jgi:hypothetical protein
MLSKELGELALRGGDLVCEGIVDTVLPESVTVPLTRMSGCSSMGAGDASGADSTGT